MKKKLFTGLLCGMFGLSLLTGCGAEKKQVTLMLKVPQLTMMPVQDSSVKDAAQFLNNAAEAFCSQYEDADVSIEVVAFELAQETEAVEQSFDTKDAPDILFEGYFNMATYIHTGRVVPLDDIISDEIAEDIDEASWQLSRTDGKTYMMPFYSLQNILTYNKQLFREAGLEKYISEEDEIQSWTVEEWEEVFAGLQKELPEGSYPMMMYAKNDQGDTHVMVLLRSQGSSFFDEEGRFHLETEEGIAGLQWIKDCYEKGYYPPKCENLEIIDMVNLFADGKLGVYIMNNGTLRSYEDLDLGYVNFPSADGKGIATSWLTGFEVFDNGDEDKIRVAKDFVKYIYENEEWMDYSTAGIPVSSTVAEKYQNDIFFLDQFYENSEHVVDFMMNNPNWRGVRDVFHTHIQDLLRGTKTPEEVAKEIDEDCNAAIEEGRKESTLHD